MHVRLYCSVSCVSIFAPHLWSGLVSVSACILFDEYSPSFISVGESVPLVFPGITNEILKCRQFEIEGVVGGKKTPTHTHTPRHMQQNNSPKKKKNKPKKQRTNPHKETTLPKSKPNPHRKTKRTPPPQNKQTNQTPPETEQKTPLSSHRTKYNTQTPPNIKKILRMRFLSWSLEYPHMKLTNYKKKRSFGEEQ